MSGECLNLGAGARGQERCGTENGYTNHKCRGQACRDAHAAYYRAKHHDGAATAGEAICYVCNDRPVFVVKWGLCRRCYVRWRRNGGDPKPPQTRKPPAEPAECSAHYCDRVERLHARGLCFRCYHFARRNGWPDPSQIPPLDVSRAEIGLELARLRRLAGDD